MSPTDLTNNESLRAVPTIQKILISTTSKMISEYEDENFLITHAWPSSRGDLTRFNTEGPASRSIFVVAFRTDPVAIEPGAVVPEYKHLGDVICSLLSIMYGKRFDNHGVIEESGHFNYPDLSSFSTLCNHKLPINSGKPRIDFPTPLNLSEVKRFLPLLLSKKDPKFTQAFITSCKFYYQALQTAERDTETAYLNLITVIEIISNFIDFDKENSLDEDMKAIISRIKAEMLEGEKIASLILNRVWQVKKKFLAFFDKFLDEDFFSRTSATNDFLSLKSEKIKETISAAYDLRSKYVHSGVSFGRFLSPGTSGGAEVRIGKPVLSDKDMAKTLSKAPTFNGLERLTRYCLIKFANEHGLKLAPNLDE